MAAAKSPPQRAPFPEADSLLTIPVVDYFLKHCHLGNIKSQFQLPSNAGMTDQDVYASAKSFIQSQLQSIIEQFREETEHEVRWAGKQIPMVEWMHLRMQAPFKMQYQESTDLASLVLGPVANVKRFPAEMQKSAWSKFQLMVQGNSLSNPNEVENLACVYCESMSQSAGFVVKGPKEILKTLEQQIKSRKCLYFRKMRNFNFMTLQPLTTMQALCRSGQVGGKGTLSDILYFGGARDINFPKMSDLTKKEATMPMSFNMMQRRALALDASISKGPVLIQGPPGTGKSHLIGNGLLNAALTRGENVLVVCNANCAVDSILEKVATSSMAEQVKKFSMRVGAAGKVAKSVASFYVSDMGTAISLLKGGQKKIVFTTLYNASKLTTDLPEWCDMFDTVVLDEAGQVEDTKMFIICEQMKKRLKKGVLVGDHKQLQPYVSEGVRKSGFGVSTLERLIDVWDRKPAAVDPQVGYVMLEVQHRMPATVRGLVSHLFYKDRLQDGPQQRGITNLADKTVLGQCVVAFDLQYSNPTFNMAAKSLGNETEVAATKTIYDFFLNNFANEKLERITSKDICILSPFNRHKELLRMEIAGVPKEMLKKFEVADDSFDQDTGDEMSMRARNFDTVDKFQGSEREVVIINTVAKSVKEEARAGDPHFINVACSRSKNMLVLIGSLGSIGQDSHYWKTIVDKLCDRVYVCKEPQDVQKYLGELTNDTEGNPLKKQRTN